MVFEFLHSVSAYLIPYRFDSMSLPIFNMQRSNSKY